MHWPTTKGEHFTGDGIKMSEAINVKSIGLEWLQDFRGVGASSWTRTASFFFAKELGCRNDIMGERLTTNGERCTGDGVKLGEAVSGETIWHCRHYMGLGVMDFYQSGAELAQDMGVLLSVLEQAHEGRYQAAKKTEKDPAHGSWPTYPSEKSWGEASGKTGSGKRFYTTSPRTRQ